MQSKTGRRPVITPDPLRIVYVVVQADDRLDETSPFQGFGTSWPESLWALRFLTLAPASILERSMPLDGLIAQRMGGVQRLTWLPLWVGSLDASNVDDFGFVTVVCTGHESVERRIREWCARQPRPVLHVSRGRIQSDEDAATFLNVELRRHCQEVLLRHGDKLSAPRRQAAQQGIERWSSRKPITGVEVPGGHNITLPNELVLLRAERTLKPQPGFIAVSEAAYDAHAIASAQSVLDVTQGRGYAEFNRFYLPVPRLILTEPALYRPSYRLMPDRSVRVTSAVRKALRWIQTQKGLCSSIEASGADEFLSDPGAQAVMAARGMELKIHSYGVGLMAAQTGSAVLRLRPAVNHVFASLSRYAANIRASDAAARRKTPRLFDDIQRKLRDAVGQARIELIERCNGPVKIVSDAPLELLPIGDLPLALRYDCSRINATPGNLMMSELAGIPAIVLDLDQLRKVLVVSAFTDADPLRTVMEQSLAVMAASFAGRVQVQFVRVRNPGEFIEALNASDATILVFDGHGDPGSREGVGGVALGGEAFDVWTLRGRARVPPIVILSACDTHSMDAPNHATVANGFIAAGALTVLATLLPIGGREGAVFVCRLLYRLAEYLPSALSTKFRAQNWCETVTGMLRMVLGFDLVDAFVSDKDKARELKMKANMHINPYRPDWHAAILADMTDYSGLDSSLVQERARAVLCRSEAIRYVQIGSPEMIRIDDGTIASQFFPPGLAERLGVD